MDTKSTLTSFWSALDVRNQSQCFPPISIMLRLIAQLLRSLEIQLIEGEGRSIAPLSREESEIPAFGSAGGGSGKPKIMKKLENLKNVIIFFKNQSLDIRERPGTLRGSRRLENVAWGVQDCSRERRDVL